MRSIPVLFPPIPSDTDRAARSLFGSGNIYLRIGKHLDKLFLKLPPLRMEIRDKRSVQSNAMYALMTAFQYAEELTDRQMVEAVRNRVDLKYALHLPLSYPRFDPMALCEFRERISAEPGSEQTFRMLIDRLSEFGLLNKSARQSIEPAHIFEQICTSTRLEIVVEAMYQALESLAVANFEWLRQVTLPHWYTRYSRQAYIPFWPNSEGKFITVALEIAADIQYLLGEINASQQPELISLREIQRLRQVWEDQFYVCIDKETRINKVQWRPTCAFSDQQLPSDKEVSKTLFSNSQ